MQVRYRLPQNDDDEGQTNTYPDDWHYVSSTRLLFILFANFLPVMLLGGVIGLDLSKSMLLGFMVVLANMAIIFFPQDAL